MRRFLVALLLLTSSAAFGQQLPQLTLKRLASGLDQPLGIVHAGDSRLFIVQQRGRIVIWDGTRILDTPFLDLTSQVSCCGERGLLGLAFHPRYAQNGQFFVYFTRGDGDVVIARAQVSATNRDVANPSSLTQLLLIEHSQQSNHNGGQLAFGPDGYLYAGVGDGGGAGDPSNNAQTLTVLLGKLLRLDVDAPVYAIPPTNPFAGVSDARSEVWAYGLRNPWRFSFDRQTGDLWIADVGQNRYEEIDLQAASSRGGDNYGWRRLEGRHCFNPATNCGEATPPIIEYSHDDGSCSITGGYRYRGVYPRMRGIYFYGDYCTGVIWGATQSTDGSWSGTKMLTTSSRITSFGEDLNGELYMVDGGGSLYQITDPGPPRRRTVTH